MVRFFICYWKLRFQKRHNQYPPWNICRLLGFISPPWPPSLSSSLSSCFPSSPWKKTFMSVSLARKSTCPTHTEQNWADLTAAQHSPPRSHLYSQSMAKHCETARTRSLDTLFLCQIHTFIWLKSQTSLTSSTASLVIYSHIVETNKEHLHKSFMTRSLLSCIGIRSFTSTFTTRSQSPDSASVIITAATCSHEHKQMWFWGWNDWCCYSYLEDCFMLGVTSQAGGELLGCTTLFSFANSQHVAIIAVTATVYLKMQPYHQTRTPTVNDSAKLWFMYIWWQRFQVLAFYHVCTRSCLSP